MPVINRPIAGSLTLVDKIMALRSALSNIPIEIDLIELINLRVLYIANCDFCIDIQAVDTRESREAVRRISNITNWQESECFSPRERTILAWTDAFVTLNPDLVSQELYKDLSKYFNSQQLVDLCVAITTVHTWNRLGVAYRKVP